MFTAKASPVNRTKMGVIVNSLKYFLVDNNWYPLLVAIFTANIVFILVRRRNKITTHTSDESSKMKENLFHLLRDFMLDIQFRFSLHIAQICINYLESIYINILLSNI